MPSGPLSRDGATRSGLRTLGGELPVFALATLADQAGRLAISLIAAAVLGPATFGGWVVITLVLQYAPIATFGLGQGAGREIPRLLGADASDEAALAEDAAAAGTILAAVLGGIVVVIAGPWLLGPEAGIATLIMFGLAVGLTEWFLLLQVLYRSRLRFDAAAVQLLVQGLAGPLVGVALLAAGLRLDALLGARVAVLGAGALVAGWTLGRVPRPRLDVRRIVALVRVGAPILVGGLLLSLVVTVDRWLVLAALGREAVGVYGIVGLAVGSLVVIPTLVSQQFYPRLAHARGAGGDAGILIRMAAQQSGVATLLTVGAAAVAAIVAVVAIPAFLPAYDGAVRPTLVALVGLVGHAWASGYGNVLNLLDRQAEVVAVMLAAVVTEIAVVVLLLALGAGLLGASLGLVVGLLVGAAGLRWRAGVAASSDAAG